MIKILLFLACLLSFNVCASETELSSMSWSWFVSVLLLGFLLCFTVCLYFKRKKQSLDMLKFSSQPILLSKNSGRIIFANDAFVLLTGFAYDELLQKNIYHLLPTLPNCLINNSRYKKIQKNVLCNCAVISPDKQEFRLVNKDNVRIAVSVSVLKRKDGNLAIYLKDLTITKQLKIQLAKQNKTATLGEFLAGVLHEVGNPMAAIEGIASNQLWQMENQQGEFSIDNLKQQLQMIREQAARVNQVKNEFSHLSSDASIDENKSQLIDIVTLVYQLTDLAKFDKRSRSIEFKIDAQPHLPAVESHPGKVTQILLNVLSNAIDALHEQVDACINSSIKLEQEYLKITITDNGPGIDSDILDKIFEPFYTTKSQGTGLGLIICKRLCDSISAKLEIDSTLGEHTHVHLYLPLTKPNSEL